VTKEAAAMILTDDDFSTIVKAVHIGRALYDNLTKYIRFQMGVLIGFIVTFLGASIFNIVSGVPFVPLQTLWVNFTTQVFQSVGLGYGEPASGLMERKPRPEKEPILQRALLIWLVVAGIVIGGTTLGIIWWADDHYDSSAIARTMGLTTFAIANVYFSFCVKDDLKSIFDLDTVSDSRLMKATALSAIAIVLGAQFDFLNRVLGTVSLTGRQWVICILAACTIVVASEVYKLIRRRRLGSASGAGEAAPESAPATAPSAP
jgi:Ca2+-transporting ATPase